MKTINEVNFFLVAQKPPKKYMIVCLCFIKSKINTRGNKQISENVAGLFTKLICFEEIFVHRLCSLSTFSSFPLNISIMCCCCCFFFLAISRLPRLPHFFLL